MKNYESIIKENREWAEKLFEALENKLSVMTVRSRDKIPSNVDENKMHNNSVPEDWVSGFWGGLNLLMYKKTGKEEYLLTAKSTEKRHQITMLLHRVCGPPQPRTQFPSGSF